MTLDLTQFHETFFAESFEALDSMEAALLKLSAGDADLELVNTIFRVAHSIKGGSATFGFSDIAGFTHTLETLLDQLRSGKRRADAALVDTLLRAGDLLREMLGATQAKQPIDKARVGALHAEIELVLETPGDVPVAVTGAAAAVPAVAAPAPSQSPSQPAVEDAASGWRIHFVPGPKLLRNGNDPLRLLRELATLAPCEVRVDAKWVPPLAELDAEECRLSWRVEMKGAVEEAAIRAVFDWVEGECDLNLEAFGPALPVATPVPAAEPQPAAPPAAASAGNSVGSALMPVPTPVPDESAARSPIPAASTPPAAPPAAPPQGAAPAAHASGSADGGSIRVSIEKIDELLNSVGELVITQSVLSQLAAPLEGRQAEDLRNALGQLERHMRGLQESVMRVRMLPISVVFNRFPRLVRDLGQRLGKRIELRLTGDSTELDKTVLEKIGDPLVHLVRNAIDHGIETPEVRLAAGKPAHGVIELNAYHKGGNVVVEVSDDGGGLKREKILAKARERGLVTGEEELSEERVFNLIFAPGFSTAEVVSDVSGRGVGMDVVKRNINELGGHVQIHSTPGKGSMVRIRLPLTLAILDGQLARVGSEVYVVPIVSIVETIQVRAEQVSSIAARAQVFRLRDDYLPIVRLYELFGIEPQHTELLDGLLMIVEADGKRVGLFVDELMAQQQVVIKSLETNFRPVLGFAGATMLGDGRVALILDIPGLITRFQDRQNRRESAQQAAA
ncbi:MAG TPA: chemotaxis protein CheA [Steroidobacteraceae bacterium]|nr:chemotaxis protein CheA [Steroidobacteraceae bacterium]